MQQLHPCLTFVATEMKPPNQQVHVWQEEYRNLLVLELQIFLGNKGHLE